MNKKNLNFILSATLIFAIFYRAIPLLGRDLWFDEALTVLNFATLPSVKDIYYNYVIPNNQIVHTILLHFWINLIMPLFSIDVNIIIRFMELIISATCIVSLFSLFKDRIGNSRVLFIAILAMTLSVPFLTYATAIRGYALSSLLGVWTLNFAMNMLSSKSLKKYFTLYLIFSILLLGTIPTNLVLSAAIILYAMPLVGNNLFRNRRFYLLVLVPILAFLIVYAPIYKSFLNILQLKEGWNSGFEVLQAILAGIAVSFSVLLIPALGAIIVVGKRNYNWMFLSRLAIWLLPIPPAMLFSTAPFPRVFIVLWPIFALLIAGGVKNVTALYCRLHNRWNINIWLNSLIFIVILFSILMNTTAIRNAFSSRNGGTFKDDYFYGYYLRDSHMPSKTISDWKKIFADKSPQCYISFLADPWAFMFYANVYGANIAKINFDGPQGVVSEINDNTIIVINVSEDIKQLEKRFNIKTEKIYENKNHKIFRTKQR